MRVQGQGSHAPARTADDGNAGSGDAGTTRYICKRGDNLWDIARAHGCSLEELRAANPQVPASGLIFKGTPLNIPTGNRRDEPAPRTRTPASPEQQAVSRQRAGHAEDAARRRAVVHDMPAAAAEAPAVQAAGAARADGLPRTADGKLDVSATRRMTEAQKFDFFKAVIEEIGGTFHAGARARNIVGLRTETNPNANRGAGAEDDRFVMLWQDKNGRKHVKEYAGTTEGSDDNRRTYSSDANGDGKRDLGRIPVGHYEYTVGRSARLGDVLRPTRAFQVERDYNQDGKYTGRERRADVSAAFLFHEGSSAGCQTMDSANWGRFWGDVNSSGRPSKIGYTLLAV